MPSSLYEEPHRVTESVNFGALQAALPQLLCHCNGKASIDGMEANGTSRD